MSSFLSALAAAALLATVVALPPSAGTAATLRPGEALHPETKRHHKGGEILSVPGFSGQELPSRMYGGYITVDEHRGRHLYYLFVESQRSPSSDPLVLWMNGGPGCSSFDGFVQEHGPFSFAFKGGKDRMGRRLQDLELTSNPYSWSGVANMLYVDSPAGVGMSYYETKADAHTNDTQTAADMNTFLRRWLAAYPRFQQNDFFVSGESFGGVYVPMVSQAVLDGNDAGQEPHLRLKGYLVGNGVVDEEYDGNALVPFAAGKSLISRELHHRTSHACGHNYWNASEGSHCDKALNEVYHSISGINIYDILGTCYHGKNPHHKVAATEAISQQRWLQQQGEQQQGEEQQREQGQEVQQEVQQDGEQGQEQQEQQDSTSTRAQLQAALVSHRQWPLLGGVRAGRVPGFGELLGQQLAHIPPCLDSREMWAFCNDPAVREAIHAEPIDKIGAFDECTNGDRIHYTHNVPSMLPVHKDLISRGLTALIYSGDHDMAVPVTGTEAWTSWLGRQLGEERPWAPWHTADHQVAGYAVHYRGLVFATIRGAGHMVPETKPAEALELFTRFLKRMQL